MYIYMYIYNQISLGNTCQTVISYIYCIYQIIYIYMSCDIGLCLETIFVDAYETVENKGTYFCLSISLSFYYLSIHLSIISIMILPSISYYIRLHIEVGYQYHDHSIKLLLPVIMNILALIIGDV